MDEETQVLRCVIELLYVLVCSVCVAGSFGGFIGVFNLRIAWILADLKMRNLWGGGDFI